jgi:hypothetical protein
METEIMKNNRFNSLLGAAWRRFSTPSCERGGSMTVLEIALALLVAVLFCGCGGASGRTPASSPSAPSSAPHPPIALGNWQFAATSTVAGEAPLTFAGSIGQAGATINGALHVDGSNCFDPLTTLSLTGAVTADSTSLTSAAINGQVVTFTGNFDDSNYNGTYRINGGCAAGQQGSLAGINVLNIGNDLSGTFTNSAQKTFNVVGTIAQSNIASPAGSFGITGTATFGTPCLSTGTIQPGTFPSGSFILGRSVALEVQTSNGILTFLGTLSQSGSGEMSGNYTISGGGCDDSGSAVLQVTGEWG